MADPPTDRPSDLTLLSPEPPDVHPGAESFVCGPVSGPPVLLFHGLTGAPSELWPLGRALATLGYRVHAPAWPGHGTSPSDLARATASDVLAAARMWADRHDWHAIVGLSMGALAALSTSAQSPRRLVLLAPAARLTGASAWFDRLGMLPLPTVLGTRLLSKGPREMGGDLPSSSWEAAPDREGVARWSEAARVALATAAPPVGLDGRYDQIPLAWSRHLRTIRETARAAARTTTAPTLILHGTADRTADPEGARLVQQWLEHASCDVRWLPGAPHVLPLAASRGDVAAMVGGFLDRGHVSAAVRHERTGS